MRHATSGVWHRSRTWDEVRDIATLLRMPPSVAEAVRWLESGRLDKAAQSLRVLLAVAPRNVEVHLLAGKCALMQGKADEALAHTRRAWELAPGNALVASNLGGLLGMLGRSGEALEVLERAAEAKPGDPLLLGNLCGARHQAQRYADAEDAARELLRLQPDHPDALTNLAMTLHVTGRTGEAIGMLERLAKVDAATAARTAASATFLLYESGYSAARVREAHVRWARAALPAPGPGPARRTPTSGPLRVGIISPDLRVHSVAYFVEPLLRHLDPARFACIAYHTNANGDATTTRLREAAAAWRDLGALSPEAQLAALRGDRLDAIVELSGLTTGHSLHLLEQRVAPVQITYLGYPATTGCSAIDARIVDEITDPAGSEAWCVERLARMEAPFLCYAPPAGAPGVGARSVDVPFTLGCFGFLGKYSEAMVRAWGRVMVALPEARLVLKSQPFSDARTRERTLARFVGAGIDAARIEVLSPTASIGEHLACYERIDLALDTFPYAGTTTTCEALLMGVATATLVGESHASRVGLTLLKAVGMEEYAVEDEDGLVEVVKPAAREVGRLRAGRGEIRERLLRSRLCDGGDFARRFGRVVMELCGRGTG